MRDFLTKKITFYNDPHSSESLNMMLNGRDKPLNAVQVLEIDSFQNLSYEKNSPLE
jgi:hypothetical protein